MNYIYIYVFCLNTIWYNLIWYNKIEHTIILSLLLCVHIYIYMYIYTVTRITGWTNHDVQTYTKWGCTSKEHKGSSMTPTFFWPTWQIPQKLQKVSLKIIKWMWIHYLSLSKTKVYINHKLLDFGDTADTSFPVKPKYGASKISCPHILVQSHDWKQPKMKKHWENQSSIHIYSL